MPKKQSPAQLANLQRMREARSASRAHAALIPEAEVLATPAETDDLLAQLAAALGSAGADRAARNAQIRQLEQVLATLSPKDYPGLLENPAVAQFVDLMSERKAASHPDDPPGTIYDSGTLAATKKPWTWRDLDRMPVATFTPVETIIVTYNGLSLTLLADQEMTVPKCFKDIYDERRRGMETARQHAALMFRQRGAITGIADPTVLTPATSRVRGSGVGDDGYRPGAGLFPYGAEEGEEGAKEKAK